MCFYTLLFYRILFLKRNLIIMSKLYISWRKITRYIFRLSPRTHNYIVSNLGNCIIGRLYSRLCRYILYNLLHYTEYTNHQYDICKTVIELCELRDGVAHRGVVNRTDIWFFVRRFYVLINIHSYHCSFY